VAQAQLTLQEIADCAMRGESALLDEGIEVIQRLPGFRLNVVQLGGESFVNVAHWLRSPYGSTSNDSLSRRDRRCRRQMIEAAQRVGVQLP
jgi:hypothetical protein